MVTSFFSPTQISLHTTIPLNIQFNSYISLCFNYIQFKRDRYTEREREREGTIKIFSFRYFIHLRFMWQPYYYIYLVTTPNN